MKGILRINSNYIFLFFIFICLASLSACSGVTPSGPTISSFTATSTSITEGESITLSWVTDADSISIDQGVGLVTAPSGSTTVTPTSTTTYTLTATNSAGSSTDTVTVTVNQATTSPIINSFAPTAFFLEEGESTTLSWETTGATTVYLFQQSEFAASTGTVDLSGSRTISPSETTNYTLTATNSAGSSTATVTIIVNPAAIVEQTIVIQPGSEEGKDCWFSDSSYATHGTDDDLLIDNGYVFVDLIGNTSSIVARALLQFDLSDLPEDAVIVNASLKLYQNKSHGGTWSIGAHQVTESWEEDEVIWLIQPDFSSTPESTTSAMIDDTGWLSWNIASLVQRWLNGDITNYGVVLKATEEGSQTGRIDCYSSDYTGNSTRHPKLEITYYVP